MYNSEWYINLTKPPYAPPDEVFAPVWSVLYIMLAAALVFYIFKKAENKKSGYILFVLQLFLNLAWSPVFFLLQNIPAAFGVILLLDIFALAAAEKFYSVSKTAGLLMLPYLFWLLFASYLNLGYMLFNVF